MPAPNHLSETQRERLLNELRENESPLIRPLAKKNLCYNEKL